ncbi:hypothetical protein BC831DRAFT_459943 [Entophlyctis helioformis]|nr:hypothetical protein BC831DRAFT_459943 [Entophlyctis helioformis]
MDDSDTVQPYWAPVAGWEKRWVLPRPSPQNSIVATLGARPSNTSKPPPNHYRVCKWVRVPGKAMPSLKDEGATPVPEEAAAAVDADAAMSVEPATADAADAADEAGSASVQATLEPQAQPQEAQEAQEAQPDVAMQDSPQVQQQHQQQQQEQPGPVDPIQ